MANRTKELDAAYRIARSKATLGLLVTTALVVGLFVVRRDAVAGVLALTFVLFLVASRVRSWTRALRRAQG